MEFEIPKSNSILMKLVMIRAALITPYCSTLRICDKAQRDTILKDTVTIVESKFHFTAFNVFSFNDIYTPKSYGPFLIEFNPINKLTGLI